MVQRLLTTGTKRKTKKNNSVLEIKKFFDISIMVLLSKIQIIKNFTR